MSGIQYGHMVASETSPSNIATMIETKQTPLVLTLDGNSEHVAHV